MGRPRLKIDPEQVKELARIGCTKNEVARILGCDWGTIDNRFSDIFEQGNALGKTQLRRSQHKRATEDESDRMLIHLGMSRLGQTTKVDVTTDGKPVQSSYERIDNSRDQAIPPPAAPEGVLPE